MVIDFGQTFRTPMLTQGTTWYRRVLKVLPYIVCSYGADGFAENKYYMWDETTAKKGADEVISVVHDHILTTVAEDVEHLIIQ